MLDYLEELNYCRDLALKEADESDREYHRIMIGEWHSGIATSDGALNVKKEGGLLQELKDAVKAKDYGKMQQIFFTYNKRELSWHFSSSCDHCFIAHSVIPYLCCAEYGEIYNACPEDLPLADNGHAMLVNATSLLQCILYKGRYDEQKVIANAEKYIASKDGKWYRAYVACFLAILKEDADMLSDNLQIICENHSRRGYLPAFGKYHCQYAYGLVIIARHNLPEDVFGKVRLPVYKTFDRGYMEWLYAGEFVRKSIYDYKAPFEEFNLVYEMPLPKTMIHQKYLNEDRYILSPREKRAYYIDDEAMDAQVLDYVMKRLDSVQ